jgi:hypothetical protein
MTNDLNNIYVGLIVNNRDPSYRGRVQVFIPHITNNLYKDWNKKNEDIKFKSFESNAFTPDIIQRLIDVLPWAEVAMPFFGGGTAAPINTDTYSPNPIPTSVDTNNLSASQKKSINLTSSSALFNPLPTSNGLNNIQGKVETISPFDAKTVSGGASSAVAGSTVPISDVVNDNNGRNLLEGLSDNEIKYAMRIGAAETGAGIYSSDYVLKQATNLDMAVTNSRSNGTVNGETNWNGVDVGFCQSNYENVTAAKLPNLNNGTYKEQILSTAQQIRITANTNPNVNQALQYIRNGDYASADQIIGSRKYSGKNDGVLYFALLDHPENAAQLEKDIKNKSVMAALDDINNQLPSTSSIEKLVLEQRGKSISLNGTSNTTSLKSIKPSRKLALTTSSFNDTGAGVKSVGNAGGQMGMFSIPQIGAKAFVMFLNGNILQPIVIGAYQEPTNGGTAVKSSATPSSPSVSPVISTPPTAPTFNTPDGFL